MEKQETYKGRMITAETREQGRRYGWSYQIDGEVPVESRGLGLHSEQSAINEALFEAKSQIDSRPHTP